MLEHIRVVAYEGTPPAPISHAAAVSVRDARTLLVTVYDASTSAAVEAAILASPLGLTPQRGESDIVVPVPELTPQHRLPGELCFKIPFKVLEEFGYPVIGS